MNAISTISSKLDSSFGGSSVSEDDQDSKDILQSTHTSLSRKSSFPHSPSITLTHSRRRNPFALFVSFFLELFASLGRALKLAFRPPWHSENTNGDDSVSLHSNEKQQLQQEKDGIPNGKSSQSNRYPLKSGVATGLVTRNPRRSTSSQANKISDTESNIRDMGNSNAHTSHKRGRLLSVSATSISSSPSLGSLLRTKTLVLDLDETLIHSTSRGGRSHAHMVEVMMDKHAVLYYVYKRPHVDYFLRKVSEWYKVVIFTASMQEYADPVIDWLDQGRGMVSRRLFRQSCTQRNGSYCKDLILVESDLSKVCLVDNSPMSYSIQKENGIPIQGWTSDPTDEALLDLLPFLDSLRFTSDVRSILSFRTLISNTSIMNKAS